MEQEEAFEACLWVMEPMVIMVHHQIITQFHTIHVFSSTEKSENYQIHIYDFKEDIRNMGKFIINDEFKGSPHWKDSF